MWKREWKRTIKVHSEIDKYAKLFSYFFKSGIYKQESIHYLHKNSSRIVE